MLSPRLFLMAAVCIAGAVCGCQSPQSPQAQQAAPPVQALPSDAPPAATNASAAADATREDPADAPPVVSSADMVARQAEQHVAAIEALLNARSTEDAKSRGVQVVDATQPPAPDPAAGKSAQPQAMVNPAVVGPKATEVKFGPSADAGTGTSPKLNPPASDLPGTMTPPAVSGTGTGNAIAAAAEPVQLPAGVQARTSPAVPLDVTESLTPKAAVSGSLELALAKRAREYPRDLASQLDHQLVLFLKDETVPQAQALGSLTAEDRDVLTAVMDGLANFRNAVRDDNNLLMNRKIRPLVEMSERLRTRSDLAIPAALLCKEVRGYGLYTPIEPARFEAGLTHPVIVYCEVDNFSSQLNDKQLWETKLDQEIVLYTETGLQVWNDKKTTYTDASRNRRRDFFVNKIVTLPANLPIGRFVFKVTMTDAHANRVAETSIPISVVAK